MALRLQLQLIATLCLLCGQPEDESRNDGGILDVLCGVRDPYALCPVCLQDVAPEVAREARWLEKVRATLYEHYAFRVHEKESPHARRSRSSRS